MNERAAEARRLQLTARLRECLSSPLRSSKNEDFFFFRMALESGVLERN